MQLADEDLLYYWGRWHLWSLKSPSSSLRIHIYLLLPQGSTGYFPYLGILKFLSNKYELSEVLQCWSYVASPLNFYQKYGSSVKYTKGVLRGSMYFQCLQCSLFIKFSFNYED